MTRPIVALTAPTKPVEGMMRVRLNQAYIDAVRAAGLVPLVVPPLSESELAGVVEAVDGIVLTGGEDVDPVEFGARRHPKTQEPHKERDQCELSLVRIAREMRIPTLAICRGMQLVNVAFGGTLIQDIASERPNALRHDRSSERTTRVHDVRIETDSRLARAVGASDIVVNTSHHQAVDSVPPELRVSAHAPDGIIEGAEWTADDWWMLAVQWHPEELVSDGQQWDRGLFRAFATAVRESANRR
ncbi:MAG: gamma-glutamyl-gamma-aminobutyrate hydrolase family protein [Gemmatimonadaceae bacterium]